MTRFVLFFLILLGGCAAKKIVIQNADTLMLFEANQYLNLEGDKKTGLKKDIISFLSKTQLKVKETLPLLQLKDSLSLQETLLSYERVEALIKTILQDFISSSPEHLSGLSMSQQKDFLNHLKKKNQKIKERTQKLSQDKIFSRFQYVLGDLSGEQKKLLMQYEEYFQTRHKERIKRREKLYSDLKFLFAEFSDPVMLKPKIHSLLSSYHDSAWEGHKHQELIKKIYPTLSQKQLNHFIEKKTELDDLLHYFIKVQY